NKAHVVVAGQTALKATLQAKRPRNGHVPLNFTVGRELDTTQQTDQCRFAGTVPPQHRDLFTSRHGERYVTQNAMAFAFAPISFGVFCRPDHSITTYLRPSRINHNPNKVKQASTNAVYAGSP